MGPLARSPRRLGRELALPVRGGEERAEEAGRRGSCRSSGSPGRGDRRHLIVSGGAAGGVGRAERPLLPLGLGLSGGAGLRSPCLALGQARCFLSNPWSCDPLRVVGARAGLAALSS